MDSKTKSDLLSFLGSSSDHVGDLGTWIQSPRRRFHRHEFFGVQFATLRIKNCATPLRLRDLAYGGLGLSPTADQLLELPSVDDVLNGELQILGTEKEFELKVRHMQPLHVGMEFLDLEDSHYEFLRSYLQYMDAALAIRQAEPTQVFPAFRDPKWLNLQAHRGSLRFHMVRSSMRGEIEAFLVFVMNEQHLYCHWTNQRIETGLLNGQSLPPQQRQQVMVQAVCLLLGIRQGASLENFAPIIETTMAAARSSS